MRLVYIKHYIKIDAFSLFINDMQETLMCHFLLMMSRLTSNMTGDYSGTLIFKIGMLEFLYDDSKLKWFFR